MDEKLTQEERRLYEALMKAAQGDEALSAFIALASRDQYAAMDDDPGPETLRAVVRADLRAWDLYEERADEMAENALADLLNGGICER